MSKIKSAGQIWPLVSVIMPIRNEGPFIERSLRAVLEQNYSRDRLEVLIADGMSTDGTRQVIERLKQQSEVPVKLLDNPQMIVSTGLNAALAEARGEIIIRVDGHTVIAPEYVSACVAALQRTGADNVGGRMTPASKTAFGEAVAAATSSRFGVGRSRFHYSDKEEFVDTVYMGAWPREVFERIGVFDEEMVRNQDDEFNYRLRASGGRILLDPRIKSLYYNRSNARSLWRQYLQYGFWKVRVLQRHPRQMQPRQFAPLLFVGALLLALLLLPFFSVDKYLMGMVAVPYYLINLAVSVYAARKYQWRLVPVIVFAFGILHLAYGLGFLIGLIRFCKRWGETHRLKNTAMKISPVDSL